MNFSYGFGLLRSRKATSRLAPSVPDRPPSYVSVTPTLSTSPRLSSVDIAQEFILL